MKLDPVINAIHHGIRDDITFALEHKRYRATLLLSFSAMDAMAFLDMPAKQSDVTRTDFINWTSRHIVFPGEEQLTGIDLYGARCGLLHTYSAHSKLSREGDCRHLVFIHQSTGAPVIPHRGARKYVLVSISALVDALFAGIDRFLPQLFADSSRAAVAEERLGKLMLYEEVPKSDPRFRGFVHRL